MSATEQQQHPRDQEDPKDGERLSERVGLRGDAEGPGIRGHMGKTGAPVGHRGRV
jgi:hypothetical protein